MTTRTIYLTQASNTQVLQQIKNPLAALGPTADCHNIRFALDGIPDEVSDDTARHMAEKTGFVFLGDGHGYRIPFQKLNSGGLVAIR